jgi:hypothetical protein
MMMGDGHVLSIYDNNNDRKEKKSFEKKNPSHR